MPQTVAWALTLLEQRLLDSCLVVLSLVVSDLPAPLACLSRVLCCLQCCLLANGVQWCICHCVASGHHAYAVLALLPPNPGDSAAGQCASLLLTVVAVLTLNACFLGGCMSGHMRLWRAFDMLQLLLAHRNRTCSPAPKLLSAIALHAHGQRL